jgi:hypothetical protein
VTAPTAAADLLGLSVARLGLRLDARGTGLRLAAPPSHAKFLVADAARAGLTLRIRHGQPVRGEEWSPLFYPSETWELWQDKEGRYVFVAPRQCPPRRQVTVDSAFTAGEVVGELGTGAARQALYPLDGIDIVLYVNWLAEHGDVILHACGVEAGGAGYCFAGGSGAGKSTLAESLASSGSVTVLGEDQVILRRLDGRFWIFGTPWHLNPDRCSPRGAPLARLFFLERAGAPGALTCAPLDGIARLLQTGFVPYYRPAAVSKILDNLAHLAEQVPFYTLGYRLGTDAMQFVAGP